MKKHKPRGLASLWLCCRLTTHCKTLSNQSQNNKTNTKLWQTKSARERFSQHEHDVTNRTMDNQNNTNYDKQTQIYAHVPLGVNLERWYLIVWVVFRKLYWKQHGWGTWGWLHTTNNEQQQTTEEHTKLHNNNKAPRQVVWVWVCSVAQHSKQTAKYHQWHRHDWKRKQKWANNTSRLWHHHTSKHASSDSKTYFQTENKEMNVKKQLWVMATRKRRTTLWC